jgi:oligosaccharide repeat unit polymerase
LILALFVWKVLIDKFGSIPGVFLNALTIYRSRVAEGGVEGVIPYTGFLPFSGVFLSGLYVAYKKRIGVITLLPFMAVILNQVAVFGRAGILFAFFLFIVTIILFRHYLSSNRTANEQGTKLKLTVILIIIVSLAVASAGLIRSFRHTIESYSASSQSLENLRGGFFITPSLYLYASSHVGVLNAYLRDDFNEDKMIGETTFQPFYNFISKLEWVKHPEFYEKGYFIPMWTNTGTYLRDLFGDFGVSGVILIPFFLGLFASLFWFKFCEQGRLWQLVILIFLFVIIMFSFLVMYTKFASFLFNLVFLLLLLPLLEKLAVRFSE